MTEDKNKNSDKTYQMEIYAKNPHGLAQYYYMAIWPIYLMDSVYAIAATACLVLAQSRTKNIRANYDISQKESECNMERVQIALRSPSNTKQGGPVT